MPQHFNHFSLPRHRSTAEFRFSPRNALGQVLTSARFAVSVQHDAQHVELLASAHRLIRAQRERHQKCDGRQLTLF